VAIVILLIFAIVLGRSAPRNPAPPPVVPPPAAPSTAEVSPTPELPQPPTSPDHVATPPEPPPAPPTPDAVKDETVTQGPPAETEDTPVAQPPRPAPQQPPESDGTKPESPDTETPDAMALFAGLQEIDVQLDSDDPNQQSKLNVRVQSFAESAINRVGLERSEGARSVMHLRLEISQAGDDVTLELAGELKCRTESSRTITVWEHRKQVATVPLAALQRTFPPKVTKGITEFFGTFGKDFKDAQSKKSEKAPAGAKD